MRNEKNPPQAVFQALTQAGLRSRKERQARTSESAAEVVGGPKYFTHVIADREYQAWYHIEANAVTVVWEMRAASRTFDGEHPELVACELLERLVHTA